MICKNEDGKNRVFKGVSFDLLAVGKKSMLSRMNYKKGDKVPFHSHLNEQAGFVISGKIRLRFGKYDEILKTGDSYVIPENVEHRVEVIEAGEVIDVFTPPRLDYL